MSLSTVVYSTIKLHSCTAIFHWVPTQHLRYYKCCAPSTKNDNEPHLCHRYFPARGPYVSPCEGLRHHTPTPLPSEYDYNIAFPLPRLNRVNRSHPFLEVWPTSKRPGSRSVPCHRDHARFLSRYSALRREMNS